MSGDRDGQPFKILVLGDFSGRSSGKPGDLSLKPRLIDRDNFDDVLKLMNVSLEVQGQQLRFSELEEFHPDRIHEALGPLPNPEPAAWPVARTVPTAPVDLLSAIIAEQGDDEEETDAPVALRDAADLSRFVEKVTAGHIVPQKTAAQLKQELDHETSAADRMRSILHDPALQSIESAWRALFLLVRTADTGPNLKIYILDITLPELLSHTDVLRDSLKKIGPWAVIGGNYAFGQTEAEVHALSKIASWAKALGAPFLAEALPAESVTPSDAWTSLRKSPDATWIGLALPRFLLRLPYGKSTSPIESFPFEEMPRSSHSEYLWGSPVFACLSLLAQAFESSGWDMESIPRRVEDLPVHIYYEDGEPVAKPCAEVLLTQSDAEYLMNSGVMPLASLKDQDAAVLLRFQSIADPLHSLPGF
jgi:type VI secretion system protein ImpC